MCPFNGPEGEGVCKLVSFTTVEFILNRPRSCKVVNSKQIFFFIFLFGNCFFFISLVKYFFF